MMKGFRLQVIGYSFLIYFLLSTVHCNLYPTYAADSSPSADIKAKLEQLKKEIASKAAQLKQIVDRKLKDKAYIGKVKSKSAESLTLSTDSGPKIVSINQDTVFESDVKGKTKFSKKTLAEEDYISALGDTDETGVLIAKKIILTPLPPDTQKAYLWGQIVSISNNLVTIKNADSKNVSASLPTQSDVEVSDFIILTGNKNKNDVFKAVFSYVIPPGAILKPKKIATPSAQTATPSATPSAKPKTKQKKTN